MVSGATFAKERLCSSNREGDKFLNRMVTDDAVWVHYAEPETQAQPKQWKQAGSPPSKKLKQSSSASKIILVALIKHLLTSCQNAKMSLLSTILESFWKKKSQEKT